MKQIPITRFENSSELTALVQSKVDGRPVFVRAYFGPTSFYGMVVGSNIPDVLAIATRVEGQDTLRIYEQKLDKLRVGPQGEIIGELDIPSTIVFDRPQSFGNRASYTDIKKQMQEANIW